MVHGLNSCLAIVDVLGAIMRLDVMRAASASMLPSDPTAKEQTAEGAKSNRMQGWQDNWEAVQFTGID